MGLRSIFKNSILSLTVLSVLFSCSKKVDSPQRTNEFIQRFLDGNSIRLYKSEIQRAKVNFFPASGMVVYSFWKQEKFRSNGDLYLHLYPADSNNLTEDRREHRFVNLPINNGGFKHGRPPYFYKIQNLQLPYDLSSIKTGQYNEFRKTWKSDYKWQDVLNKTSLDKKTLLSGMNGNYAARIFDFDTKENGHPFFGTKLYQTHEESETAIFYNTNLNRFTFIINGYQEENWTKRTLYVDVYPPGKKGVRKLISFDGISMHNGLGLLHYNIPLNGSLERVELIQKEDGIEEVLKAFDKKRIIYTSFPYKDPGQNSSEPKLKDNEIDIVNYLIANNLPLIYFNFTNDIALYLNEFQNRAYIVSANADRFDNMRLQGIIAKDGKMLLTKAMDLQNSFTIKGVNRQIVVHELRWDDGLKWNELQLKTGKQELFRYSINPVIH